MSRSRDSAEPPARVPGAGAVPAGEGRGRPAAGLRAPETREEGTDSDEGSSLSCSLSGLLRRCYGCVCLGGEASEAEGHSWVRAGNGKQDNPAPAETVCERARKHFPAKPHGGPADGTRPQGERSAGEVFLCPLPAR